MFNINRNLNIKFLVLLVVISIFILILLFIHYENNAGLLEVERWKNVAESESGPKLTLEEAYNWLNNHNFSVLFWNPNYKEGWVGLVYQDKMITGYMVRGSKKLFKKRIFSKPLWVDLTFYFDVEKHFTHITAESRQYQLPKSKENINQH